MDWTEADATPDVVLVAGAGVLGGVDAFGGADARATDVLALVMAVTTVEGVFGFGPLTTARVTTGRATTGRVTLGGVTLADDALAAGTRAGNAADAMAGLGLGRGLDRAGAAAEILYGA